MKAGVLTRYADFAVRAWRDDPRYIQVIAHATPVGAMRRLVAVRLGRIDRSDFEMGTDESFERAAEIGRELARILLPDPVHGMLLESIRYAAQRNDIGLRVRLCLDDELIGPRSRSAFERRPHGARRPFRERPLAGLRRARRMLG